MSNQAPSPRIAGFDDIYNGFLARYDEAPSKTRRRDLILALIAAAVLATLASLPLPDLGGWRQFIQVLVGFPAGILVFAVVVGLAEYTRIRDLDIMNWKQRHSFRSRVRTISVLAVILAAVLIVAQGAIPFGLGGTIVIVLALLGYNLGRRTPEEIELAKQGIPDPRDVKETGEEDE